MINLLWWSDTLIKIDDAYANMLADFTCQARTWCVAHNGDMRGFQYPPVTVPWWLGMVPPFKCLAYPGGCKVWKIGIDDPVIVGIADTLEPWKTVPPGFEMDVWLIVKTDNAPTWFVVAQSATNKWVCLAAETARVPETKP
jgi:hypothetical protein